MNTESQDILRRFCDGEFGSMRDLESYVAKNPGNYEAFVPLLTEALEDVDDRHFAAYILARIGKPAASAIPALVQALLYDPVNYVSQPYLEALESIGHLTPQIENAVVLVLDTLTADEICLVAKMFVGAGTYREEVAQALRDIPSWNKDEATHAEASVLCKCLEQFKPAGK